MTLEPADRADTGIGRWLVRELPVGGVMMDVGANVGDYTAVAADRVGARGRVYAFEPAPENAQQLRTRFALVPHVTVVEAAVSDRAGVATFFLDRRDGTRHSLAPANVGKAGSAVTVRQVALDDFCGEVRNVDVIKIDAQGAELLIIRGAQQLIRRFRPRITFELWPFGLRNLGADSDILLAEMEALGYGVWRLSAKGRLKGASHMRFTDRRWAHINVAAVPRRRSMLEWLARAAGR
jgi:FkbM family methyltransferase